MADPALECEQAGILELSFVVKDRHTLPWFLRLLLGAVYNNTKPLYGADDKPEPKRGLVIMDLRTPKLRPGVEVLMELLAAHTRFDLVCR